MNHTRDQIERLPLHAALGMAVVSTRALATHLARLREWPVPPEEVAGDDPVATLRQWWASADALEEAVRREGAVLDSPGSARLLAQIQTLRTRPPFGNLCMRAVVERRPLAFLWQAARADTAKWVEPILTEWIDLRQRLAAASRAKPPALPAGGASSADAPSGERSRPQPARFDSVAKGIITGIIGKEPDLSNKEIARRLPDHNLRINVKTLSREPWKSFVAQCRSLALGAIARGSVQDGRVDAEDAGAIDPNRKYSRQTADEADLDDQIN